MTRPAKAIFYLAWLAEWSNLSAGPSAVGVVIDITVVRVRVPQREQPNLIVLNIVGIILRSLRYLPCNNYDPMEQCRE